MKNLGELKEKSSKPTPNKNRYPCGRSECGYIDSGSVTSCRECELRQREAKAEKDKRLLYPFL